jgi:hypothetical protein
MRSEKLLMRLIHCMAALAVCEICAAALAPTVTAQFWRPGVPEPMTPADPDALLLPDITIDRELLGDHHITTACDGLPGVELCMRVSVGTINAGEGDLLLTAPVGRQDQVSQHISTAGGDEVLQPVGSAFVDEPSHQHLHLSDWTELRVRKIADGCETRETANRCPVAGMGNKVSFCLRDNAPADARLSPGGGDLTCGVDQGGTRIVQGISSGWMDVYESDLPGQLIDFTGLETGEYWLEVEVNPDRQVAEANYDNNLGRLRVEFTSPVCADGTRSAGEECDASAGDAQLECARLGRGYLSGQAPCDATCKYDVSTCVAAQCPQQDLGSALGASVASGPAPADENAFSALRCGYSGESTGDETTYGWAAPTASTFVFDTTGSSYDTVLYLLGPACEALPNIRDTCSDDAESSTTGASSVSLRMDQGQRVSIVVDSAASDAQGDFVLNIAERVEPVPGTPPTTAPDP